MLTWLTKSVWNVVGLIAGVLVAAFLLFSCVAGVAAFAFWPEPQTVEVPGPVQTVIVPATAIVEVPAQSTPTAMLPDSTPMPESQNDSGFWTNSEFEFPGFSKEFPGQKPRPVDMSVPGYYHFNVACTGCSRTIEDNYFIYYDGPATQVVNPEGAAWAYQSFGELNLTAELQDDYEAYLWGLVSRDDKGDFYPSGLPTWLDFEGVTLLEPPTGFVNH